MKLMIIRAAGFSATVDACARDGSQIWFLSLLGNQQSVRALWARLLKGETAYLSEEKLSEQMACWLAREAWGTWRLHSTRLPSGSAHHGLLVPDLAAYPFDRQDFLLLVSSQGAAPLLHYRFLNRRLEIPLHPGWADWVWRRGEASGEIKALDGFGISAFRCRPNLDALRRDIGDAVRGGVLSVPAMSIS